MNFGRGAARRVVAARQELAAAERVPEQAAALVAHLGRAHVQAVHLFFTGGVINVYQRE